MKKVLKITGIILLVFVVILVAIPFVLESKIDAIVQNYADKNINAKVEFDDVSLSLISSFPNAKVTIDNLTITNNKPFKDETFTTAKSIVLKMAIRELFKNQEDEPIAITSVAIDEALITLKESTSGSTNWDVFKTGTNKNTTATSTESTGFKINIEDYNITNSALTYIDENSNTTVYVTNLNHSGNALFTDVVSELDTKSEANVSLSIDNASYLENNHVTLDALIDLNLKENRYTFKENKGFINQLPLEFNGYVQLKEEGQLIDITFKNPESSFKDFLAVMPERYAKNLDNVETSGDFKVEGIIKGLVSETTIPTIDIKMVSDNASFKYPDLPKRVENININATVKNDNGNPDDTYINLTTLNFKIDQDIFKSSAILKNLGGNTLVNANLDGTLNLANISKAYPIELDKQISGILKGKLNTSFDMNAIETNSYNRIKNNGSINITDFIFSSEDIVNPIHISKADLTFKPGTISLNNFAAKTGESDISATGSIKNLIGFLMQKNKLQGDFKVKSNVFAVNDFMVAQDEAAEENKATSNKASLKIPEFLDCNITADVNTVIYDNLNLKDVSGSLAINNQQANLKGLTSKLFEGILAITGNISTQEATPTFNLNLGVDNFDIAKSFSGLELFQSLAPIANTLQGKLNSTINLKGNLNESFTPDIATISGNSFAQLFVSSINSKKLKVLEKLQDNLNFVDFNKLNLDDLKTNLSFENGLVNVKPFNIKYKDIDIQVSGSHGFDKSLNYKVALDVPAKYLGSEVNRLIGRINDSEVNKITIPVTANVSGTYASPQVSTDLTSGVSNLTKQLIDIEKQKLLNSGKDKLNDLLDGVLNKKKKQTDSTKAEAIKKDSTKTKTEDAVKSILGNLLKNRKKKKDTTN
ncbi:AsmA family protein [Pontimicrobium aquaticum]|uniref:AsmA family protein n=1 Tax=Pontimicrobium aquaticum TaxID=2565367 RepID=A0A4V5LPS2_9FLAO|nr:AsmA-like C-terminal region-containing protein [Pontimicrobium aquaticum]TJY32489.1 AsmA family protein [Pontimicrobium aquaticum]